MSDRSKGLCAIYATIVLLAATGIFAKGVQLQPVAITLYRSIATAVALLVVAVVLRIPLRLRARRDVGIMAALGMVLVFHWVTFFQSMQVSTVAIGMTALYTYPVFTLAVDALIDRRPIERVDVFVGLCVFAGVYTIAPIHAHGRNVVVGMAWGVTSAALFAIRNLAQRRLLWRYPPICSIFYQSAFGALALVPLNRSSPGQISGGTWGALLVLGVFFTAVPHTLLATSLRYLDAKTVAFIGCLQPVLGAAMATALIHEVPPWNVVLGAVVVLGGATYETLHGTATRQTQVAAGSLTN